MDHAELREVVKVVLEVLDPNQSFQTNLQEYHTSIQTAVDGLLLHYCSFHRVTHHLEDMLWFMELANKQNQWKQKQLLEGVQEKKSEHDEVENCLHQEGQVQVFS